MTHALELLVLHGIRAFYNFLVGKTDAEADSKRTRSELAKIPEFGRMMDDLKPKVEAPLYSSHPKLDKLREIVLHHFSVSLIFY